MNKIELRDFLEKNVEDLNNYEIDIFDEVLSRMNRNEYIELEEIVDDFLGWGLDYNKKVRLLEEEKFLFENNNFIYYQKPDDFDDFIKSIDSFVYAIYLHYIEKERVVQNIAYYKINNFLETKKDVFIDTEVFEDFWDSLDNFIDLSDCDDEIEKIDDFIKKIEVML